MFFFTIANGDDLCVMDFKQGELRNHLADCFRRKQLMPFPHIITPRGHVQNCFPEHHINIYCDCELPEVFDDMIECDGCERWYHQRCVGVASPTVSQKWFCKEC